MYLFATPEKKVVHPGSCLSFTSSWFKARRFNVNLLKKNGDIALHFNPRFDEKAVVRNALQAGDWGNEEREGKMPLEKGVGFDLVIANEPTQFQVDLACIPSLTTTIKRVQITVNDHHFANFAHRSDPHDITGLQIQGDIVRFIVSFTSDSYNAQFY